MVEPRVEAELVARESFDALAELRTSQQPVRRVRVRVTDLVVWIEPRRVADATKPRRRSGDVSVQDLVHGGAQREVRIADDAGRDPRRTVLPGRALRRDAVHELGLPDGPQMRRAVGAVHRHAFDEDRRDDAVPLAEVRRQLVEQVPALARVPEVMMRIDDRSLRIDRRLSHEPEPRLVRRHEGSPGWNFAALLPQSMTDRRATRSGPLVRRYAPSPDGTSRVRMAERRQRAGETS